MKRHRPSWRLASRPAANDDLAEVRLERERFHRQRRPRTGIRARGEAGLAEEQRQAPGPDSRGRCRQVRDQGSPRCRAARRVCHGSSAGHPAMAKRVRPVEQRSTPPDLSAVAASASRSSVSRRSGPSGGEPVEETAHLGLRQIGPIGHSLLFERRKSPAATGSPAFDHPLRRTNELEQPRARTPRGDASQVGTDLHAAPERMAGGAALIEELLGLAGLRGVSQWNGAPQQERHGRRHRLAPGQKAAAFRGYNARVPQCLVASRRHMSASLLPLPEETPNRSFRGAPEK